MSAYKYLSMVIEHSTLNECSEEWQMASLLRMASEWGSLETDSIFYAA